MILKRGEIKIPHFAHLPDFTCPYHKPESEMHLRMKEWVRAQLPNAELEVLVGNTIFDVKCGDYVFECQASILPISEYKQREECALDNGLVLFWILSTPCYGKTVRRDGVEYAKLKALELEIEQNDEPLFYLEWHPVTQKMLSFQRNLGQPRISEPNEWRDEEVECKTIFEFEETYKIDLKELVPA